MFLVDWFSFSSKVDSLTSILDVLGLSHVKFDVINGFYGYRDSLYCDGIRIHYNPRTDDMGILIEMSGKGCRAFETYSNVGFSELFFYIKNQSITDYNVTRLDIAFDDKDHILPIKKIEKDTRAENFISKFRKWGIQETSEGDTVYHGSAKSDIMLRIYDKAAERRISDEHWIRVEIQLRQERAYSFLCQYIDTQNLGNLFCGVLFNYIRYIVPSDITRKDRCKLRPYWQKLINKACKVKIFTPCNLEYNLDNLHEFVVNQAGGAIETYMKIFGDDYLKANLSERKSPLNPKYKRLINEMENL